MIKTIRPTPAAASLPKAAMLHCRGLRPTLRATSLSLTAFVSLASAAFAQTGPAYQLDPTSSFVLQITKLASSGPGAGCDFGHSLTGRVVARKFDDQDATLLIAFTVEDPNGARTYVNVSADSFKNSGMAARGWIIRGLQTLLRDGNTVSLQLALCGAAGRVALLEAVSAAGAEPAAGRASAPSPAPATGAPPHECDRLAANPTDARRLAGPPGVQFKELREHLDAALAACSAAVNAYPQELRFKYQLARALQIKDKRAAFALFQQLAAAHYPAAYDNLGWMIIADSKDYAKAIELFKAGYALGDADCATSLFTMIEDNHLTVPDPAKTKIELLEKAVAAGHAGAIVALPIERAKQSPQPTGPTSARPTVTAATPPRPTAADTTPYTAILTCTFNGATMDIILCFVGRSSYGGLELRNGADYHLYQFQEIPHAGSYTQSALTIALQESFAISVQNRSDYALLNLEIRRSATNQVIFKKSVETYGVINVNN